MTARPLCAAADFRFAQKRHRILVWSLVASVAAIGGSFAVLFGGRS